jgi:hypothetical protein
MCGRIPTILPLLALALSGCSSLTSPEQVAARYARKEPGGQGLWHYQGTDDRYHHFFEVSAANVTWSPGSEIAYVSRAYRIPKAAIPLPEVDAYSPGWPLLPYYYSVRVLDGFKRVDEKAEWPADHGPPAGPVPIPPALRRVTTGHIQDPAKTGVPPVALAVSIDTSRVDRSRPEIGIWAERAARVCQDWYPIICHAVVPPGIDPPHRVTLVFMPHSTFPGYCDGKSQIILDTPNILRDPTNYGIVVHELTHLPQKARSRRLPWLTEGIADYTRWCLYEVDPSHGSLRPGLSKYTDSYRTTACFLDYLVRSYDPEIVLKFSRALRNPFTGLGTIRRIVAQDSAVVPEKRKSLEDLFENFMAEAAPGPSVAVR